jgi:DeoR/GlpR family transcriptional regulator of sugar metabolism
MEAIATQLGVSHPTLVRDLKEFVHDEQIKKPAKAVHNADTL